MKITLFIVLVTLAAATYAEPLQIDLPTALRLADEKNTDLAIQVQNVAKAELDKSAAWYQWVPTLRIGASYGWQDGALQETGGNVVNVKRNSRYAGFGAGAYGSGLPTHPGLSVGIDLSEAIYAPLAAKRNLQATQFGEESTRLRIMLQVASAYYELIRATREVQIAKLSADNAGQLAKQTTDFSASGEGLQADAERAEVESLIQQQKVELALERKNAATIQLIRLLRLDDEVEFKPMDSMITPLSLIDSQVSIQDFVAQALKNRPEINQSRAMLAAEDARLKQQLYGIFLPKVEVGYSYGKFGGGSGAGTSSGGSYEPERDDLYGMVYWQFDSLGLRNRNTIKRQRAQMNTIKAMEEQTVADISANVRMAHAEFIGAKRQLALSKRAVDSARKSYELNRERIFENIGLPLETLQSIKALAETESLHLSVATKYNMAQLRLISATGQGLKY